MSSTVIWVDNIGKKYRVGHYEARGLLRDKLAQTLRSPLALVRRKPKETFWALKDISFEVKEGEVLGLIGRNGAGKSTLLRILSRITRPTRGRAWTHGRVGSLLEVGTGFHPELTGRENVFLNGAILGMSKQEIVRKFDEIVAFAGIERFIDTPVKRYSSGMYVRLAFAVAAHLDPDILFVDEVLSVGDINFQKKCLGKMDDVARHGRTIIFISHQMNQIRRLCSRVIWLHDGSVRESGSVEQVLASYEVAMTSRTNANGQEGRLLNEEKARFVSWEILEPRSEDRNTYASFDPLRVRFVLRVNCGIQSAQHGIALFNTGGQLIWGTACDNLRLEPGTYGLVYSFPTLPLRPGAFSWRVSLYEDGNLLDAWDCVPNFVVATKPVTHPQDEWSGILNLPCDFNVGTYDR